MRVEAARHLPEFNRAARRLYDDFMALGPRAGGLSKRLSHGKMVRAAGLEPALA